CPRRRQGAWWVPRSSKPVKRLTPLGGFDSRPPPLPSCRGRETPPPRLRRMSNGPLFSAEPRSIHPPHWRGRRNPMRPKHVVVVAVLGLLLAHEDTPRR